MLSLQLIIFVPTSYDSFLKFFAALEDLQKAAQIDENYPGLNEKVKKAQKLLKQSQKRDYYKILGVSRQVSF